MQVPDTARQVAKSLDRQRYIGGLIDVGLPERSGPVDLVRHHFNDAWVVRDRFYADIPILIIDAGWPVAANPARRLFDLIREGGGNEQLSQQGIGIKSDGREQIV